VVRPAEGGMPPVLFWALCPPREIPKPRLLVLVKKLRGIFPRFYFLRRQTRRRLLLKTTSDSAVLSKYVEIPEKIIEQSTCKK
jgi:hypothetical protein